MSIVVNGRPLDVPAGTSVAALLLQLELEPRHVAVEINLELVPRTQHADRFLAAADQVEVVTLVGGG
ncbi:MAG: sulfur carrier protein ThiS [Planctomycetia bacterium]|nr:sulfur carrier protein ThiS [Planctomycetia bacterium]